MFLLLRNRHAQRQPAGRKKAEVRSNGGMGGGGGERGGERGEARHSKLIVNNSHSGGSHPGWGGVSSDD